MASFVVNHWRVDLKNQFYLCMENLLFNALGQEKDKRVSWCSFCEKNNLHTEQNYELDRQHIIKETFCKCIPLRQVVQTGL